MKHKIAILTQPLSHNYGGIIQNYALQKVLTDLGHQTITINRRGDNRHSKIRVLASKYKTIVYRNILQPNNPKYFNPNIIFENNHRFLEKHINLSPSITTTSSLSKYFNKEQFTDVVVGSDQVWRPKYSPNIYNFYLDFLQENTTIKKISYAASFGTEEWEYSEEETEYCKNLIQQFNAISVREDSGAVLCKIKLNRDDAVHVLDPAILLEAEDYSTLINKPKKEIGLYTYVLDETNEKLSFIKNCADKLNLKIYKNQAKYKTNNPKSDDINDYITPPLEGWLQGFRDAEFVITDSFHGTIFSILNEKPFLVLVNKKRGASRFESFLKQLDLSNRLIYNINDFDKSKLKEEIDYSAVKSKLKFMKSESINFLKNQF